MTPPDVPDAIALELSFHEQRADAVRLGVTDLGGHFGHRRAVLFQVEPGGKLLDAADGEAMAVAADAARRYGRPLVGVLAAQGTDVFAGVGGLHAWGRAAKAIAQCSGVVPVALIVDGPLVGGPALLLGLADVVVMTAGSYSFVNGPAMVADYTGLRLDNNALGGPDSHARSSGVATAVVADLDAALATVAEILAFLPDHADDEPPLHETLDPIERTNDALNSLIPAVSTGSYDVRSAVRSMLDDDAESGFVELKQRWAPNLVCGFGRVAGRSVGIVANQPMALAGTLDIVAAQKGAWFVSLCDAFNVPIITFVDTPGYFPGKDLEWRGMIRHGAQMAFAYAEASVPRICVVLREAYGGAYIVMDCKTMGNDLCVAWPSAELAVMGAKGAVQILYRREDEATRLVREADYAVEYLNPFVAAERGYVDAVIEPSETRRWVARSVQLLAAKRELLVGKRHGNSPL